MGWKSWKSKGYFGEGSDILWIEHMATQIPLESFKSLQKIDRKHEIKGTFHICLTDEIWSVRPPSNIFNKMSTRENDASSNHKNISF